MIIEKDLSGPKIIFGSVHLGEGLRITKMMFDTKELDVGFNKGRLEEAFLAENVEGSQPNEQCLGILDKIEEELNT
jgi:hypothetical protein